MSKNSEKANQEAAEQEQMVDSQTQQEQNDTPQEELTEEEKMAARLAESIAQQAELQDRYLRQAAEFDNYRKRTLKEKAEYIKTASADVLTNLLPIIDDFERALKSLSADPQANAVKEGVELIYNKLMKTLEAQGLKKIPAKDTDFDTDVHEAIAMIPAPAPELKGKVIDCTRDGYMLNDKVLRVAQVVVAN
ncbi:MAG: nucleotide exchange factor GrpE [Bacteroidaceae bacterium]|nr:nucleotide exchange factor GrpE [Bacteroidaceae bacterium]